MGRQGGRIHIEMKHIPYCPLPRRHQYNWTYFVEYTASRRGVSASGPTETKAASNLRRAERARETPIRSESP